MLQNCLMRTLSLTDVQSAIRSFTQARTGLRDRIRVKLDEKLSELKEYHKAKGDLQKAETTLLETASELKNELEVAASFEECSGREEIQVYLEDLPICGK